MTTNSSIRFNAGHVVEAVFPFAEGEGSKPRPVLVVTDSDANGDFVVVAITGAAHHKNSVPLVNTDLAQGRLNKPSHVRADKIFSMNAKAVTQTFGVVKPNILGKVKSLICPAVGCK
ncbi:MAG: hypothetical protein EPN14_04875 [Gallionella sp.]|nr:MAG: hypothetical protein EPN14_04875 [Gallionella sp.]